MSDKIQYRKITTRQPKDTDWRDYTSRIALYSADLEIEMRIKPDFIPGYYRKRGVPVEAWPEIRLATSESDLDGGLRDWVRVKVTAVEDD